MLAGLIAALAYLIGSVSSAVIVCRLMGLPDPRSSGSNNPGATNVLRIGGKKAAVVTLAGDVLKGLIPVLAARVLSDNPWVLCLAGLGAFLGHLYPIFFGFKGGKGVATAAGVFIGMSIPLSAALLLLWLTVVLAFRYSSLAALVSAALAPFIALWLLPGLSYFLLTLMIAIFLFWRHRENIRRLISGQETKVKLFSGARGSSRS